MRAEEGDERRASPGCREGISGDQLKVDVADILSYNAELAKYVLENPTESLPLVSHSSPTQGDTYLHMVPLPMPTNMLVLGRAGTGQNGAVQRAASLQAHAKPCHAREWR